MLTEKKYENIQLSVFKKLNNKLSKKLYYHGLHHTKDVVSQAERIAKAENNVFKEDILILKTGCLYHDTGFLKTYNGHEEAGCSFAEKELPKFNFNPDQVQIICGLIRSTKIPQNPLNKLEEIICDADLDYLGRDDFFDISETLFLELKEMGNITCRKEWNLIQVSFIKDHTYFTVTSRQLRNDKKLKHLEMIEAML